MGNKCSIKDTVCRRSGKVVSPLSEKLKNAKWGKFNLLDLFGKSIRGKRLKSEDRIPGNLPFVTAGEKDEGVSAFIGNEVTVFPANTTTIDMFGSAKYRSYPYGADDHIAVVNTETLSRFASIFVTTAINKSSYNGQFNYGRNFYAKDADELIIQLPILNNGQIDYDFIENFIYAVESERLKKVETYLSITGLKSYLLTPEEEKALEQFRISQNMRGGVI